MDQIPNTFIDVLTIEEQLQELKEFEKRKDAFISLASHELKTPLTTLKVYLHIFEEHFKKIKDEQHLNFAVKAGSQITKLSKLIYDLLDMSRLHSGILDYEDSIFTYTDLVKEVINNFQSSTSSHTIKFTGNASSKIKGDKERLTNAIINLLSNAVKFSPNQNKIVLQLSEENNFITTTVKDFGIGISQDHHDRIFERFYRVNDNHQQTYPGLGIGLYITAEIVKRHGGNILVKSEEGKETNFTFTLPVYSEK
jgi:signal transduction histidine kinase